MEVVCLDLEGVLIPEIWIGMAKKTGIDELRATTRDVSDYNELMQQRLRIMDENNLGLPDLQEVIKSLEPLPGALDFLNWLRAHFQVVVLSDTFYEFAEPLMRKLEWPTLFCHRLDTAPDGRITDYHLRIDNHKREAVKHLRQLNFTVYAAGDSYNDTAMLTEADKGFLIHAPDYIKTEFPQFTVARNHAELRAELEKASPRF
ncbi:MAG: bifunctional phosphoserine phosphatase/homoserine phosphotransferase ThrH [Rhodospirillales bacterium]|nr:bifunctional phosphoserine phosphatase/homoserine phosphotransferase ThrH [Rhodospirillales bacterium]